ncbi:MAG: S8 family serine peptidase [Rhodospirillaceae bacterium]|nr:S8 family serine peptidase [Rhodospirillaceae bacterium]
MRYLLRILGSLFVLGASQVFAQNPAWQAPLAAKLANAQSPQTISVLIELRAPDVPLPNPVPHESAERERAQTNQASTPQTSTSQTSTSQMRETAAQAQRIAAQVQAPFVQDMRAAGLNIREVYTHQPIVLADVRREDLATLAAREDVASVYENIYIKLSPNLPPSNRVNPNDADQPATESPEKPLLNKTTPFVNADIAWAEGYRGQGQTVAILDTGINASHEMFRGRIVAEACFSDGSIASFYESLCPNKLKRVIGPGSASLCPGGRAGSGGVCEHGSHVAGIAMGDNTSSTERLRGVAPDAGVIPIQVFTRSVGCESCLGAFTSDLVAAMDWVISNTATYNIVAVNMSLGSSTAYLGYCNGAVLESAVVTLRTMNVISVIASGNGGYTGFMSFPACIKDSFSVGSINIAAVSSYFSNVSALLDIFAPGEIVRSATYGSSSAYAIYSGTSMATPHVTGAVAVLRSKMPTATAAQVEYALRTSGPKVKGASWSWSTPRLDVKGALDVVGVDPPPPGVSLVGLFPGDRPDLRSVLRVISLNLNPIEVPVTVVQDTPNVVLGTYRMAIPANGSAQASVREMEIAIRAQAQATSLVSVILNPPREIYAQHVVVDSTGQALSNLTLCASNRTDQSSVLPFVYMQDNKDWASYITLTNTSAASATPRFYLYDGGNGTSPMFTPLGGVAGPTIAGNSTVRLHARTLFSKDVVPGLPLVPKSTSYVNVVVSNFNGLVRHEIEQPQVRSIADMTTKCAI